MDLIIRRVYLPTETLGSIFSSDGVLLAKSMELPWKNNDRNVSCIPEATYVCVREAFTVKHPYPHFRIMDVPGRSGILIHRITYVKDLRGCVGVGQAFVDLNKDGVPDIVRSTIALQELYDSMVDTFNLTIMAKVTTV